MNTQSDMMQTNKYHITYNNRNRFPCTGHLLIPATFAGAGKYKEVEDRTYQIIAIGDHAFSSCSKLESVQISNGIKSIGCNAFANCSALTSLHIPKSVTSIAYGICRNSPCAQSITVDAENPNYCDVDGVLFSKDRSTLLAYPNGKGSVYSIPEGTTHIGEDAFSSCFDLIQLQMPDSIMQIDASAFSGCYSLVAITLSNRITIIPRHAFWFCEALETVRISNGVVHIDRNAFQGCSSLTSLYLPNSITKIERRTFAFCTALKNIFYADAQSEWQNITKGADWNDHFPPCVVHCVDGDLKLQ